MGFWNDLFGKTETEETIEKTYKFLIKAEMEVEVTAATQEDAEAQLEDFDTYGQDLWDEAESTFVEEVKTEEEPVEEETEEEPVEEEAEEEPVEEVPKKQNKKKNK